MGYLIPDAEVAIICPVSALILAIPPASRGGEGKARINGRLILKPLTLPPLQPCFLNERKLAGTFPDRLPGSPRLEYIPHRPYKSHQDISRPIVCRIHKYSTFAPLSLQVKVFKMASSTAIFRNSARSRLSKRYFRAASMP